MAVRRENRVFNAGLNKDYDPRFIQNGQYIDALNLRIGTTDDGNDGAVENVKGNEVRETLSGGSTYTMPDGINRCIGSIEDQVNKRNYWFVWNSEGEHIILSYDQTTERITEVVKDNTYSFNTFSSTGSYSVGDIVESSLGSGIFYQCLIDVDLSTYSGAGGSTSIYNTYIWELVGNYLNFQEDNLIQADVMTRDGDTLLFWTDNYNEPKYCNVDALMGGTYPTALKEDYFDVKQISPLHRPIVSSSYDSSYGYGGLRGNFYQFKYRWINRDGMPSDWSPISKVELYTYNSFYEGDQFNNIISVQVGRPNGLGTGVDNFWEKIEIAVKPLANGNSGVWYHSEDIFLTETFSSASTSSGIIWGVNTGAVQWPHRYTFVFTGKEIGAAINDDEAENIFSAIPRKAKTVTVLNNNRLAYGNITEGYDTTIDLGGWTITWDTASPPSYPTAQENAATRTFKKGATYQFGVRIMDKKGRVSPVYTDDTLIFKTPWNDDANIAWNEAIKPVITVDNGSAPPSWGRSWQICYREVSTMAYEGSTPDFVQLAVSSNTGTTLQNYTSLYGATGYELVPLDTLQCFTYDYTPAAGQYSYSYSSGDRIRRYSIDNGGATPVDPSGGAPTYDKNILDDVTTSSINYAIVPGGSTSAPLYAVSDTIEIYSTTNVEQKLWYEIGDSCLIGSDFTGSWAFLALGNGTDQEIGTTDAVIYVNDADCYLVRLRMDESSVYPLTGAGTRTSLGDDYAYEQPFIDMKYASRINDRGRVNVVDESYGEATYPDRIIFTQSFNQNTDINRLSIAYAGDIVDERNSYGSIQRIHQKGQNLFVFQERKVGYHSVARQIIEDLTSQQLVGVSGEILSDITYLIEDFGIGTYPESFATFGYDMFFVDPNSLSVIKLSGFQCNVISDLNVKTYFDAVLGQSKKYNRTQIFGGYDKEFDEYTISFNLRYSIYGDEMSNEVLDTGFNFDSTDVFLSVLAQDSGTDPLLPDTFTTTAYLTYVDTSTNYYSYFEGDLVLAPQIGTDYGIEGSLSNITVSASTNTVTIQQRDTISFNNRNNFWCSRWSYFPETFTTAQSSLVSFKDGKFYLHNVNTDYATFYGTSYNSTLDFVLNQESPNNKVYNTFGIDANRPTGVTFTNERGQRTTARVDDFQPQDLEGIYWSPILMDLNTPNVTYPQIQGDLLIDDNLKCKINYKIGVVESILVTNGGSGYTSAPTVTFSSGSATAYAVLNGDTVYEVVLTDSSEGYTTAPTISFSGGGGTGAAATATISQGYFQLVRVVATYQISSTVNT